MRSVDRSRRGVVEKSEGIETQAGPVTNDESRAMRICFVKGECEVLCRRSGKDGGRAAVMTGLRRLKRRGTAGVEGFKEGESGLVKRWKS